MHIIEGVTVDFLHYMGRAPTTGTKNISIGDVLSVEITGKVNLQIALTVYKV